MPCKSNKMNVHFRESEFGWKMKVGSDLFATVFFWNALHQCVLICQGYLRCFYYCFKCYVTAMWISRKSFNQVYTGQWIKDSTSLNPYIHIDLFIFLSTFTNMFAWFNMNIHVHLIWLFRYAPLKMDNGKLIFCRLFVSLRPWSFRIGSRTSREVKYILNKFQPPN